MNTRRDEDILRKISFFEPISGNWLPLDELLDDLWEVGVQQNAIPGLFKVLERFPNDDGCGVFWSISMVLKVLKFPMKLNYWNP